MRTFSQFQVDIFANVATGTGHTVVLARAGSGKTTTIVEALVSVPAGLSTLLVAFNKSIATELQARAPRGVEVSTLHSYGLKAVSRRFGRPQIESNRVDQLLKALAPASLTWDQRRAVSKTVSLAKGALADTAPSVDALIDAFGIDTETETAAQREAFVALVLATLKTSRNPFTRAVPLDARYPRGEWTLVTSDGAQPQIDFDDMIWLPVALSLPCPQFDRVFVDETQDLNPCQIELSLRACKKGGRICAVGDDRQAIYRFRGADENAVQNVIDRLQAKVMPLSVTYRCARSIVALAQTIVPDIEAAPDAPEGEVRSVSHAAMVQGAQAGDFVLSRTNAPLIGLCLGFLRDGRRANVQGRDLGAALISFMKKSRCTTVIDFLNYVDEWRREETARLLQSDPPRDTQAVEDKAETLYALSEGMRTLDEMIARVEQLFADTDDRARIVLSTTHKAKGLERDRVWLLSETYCRRPGVEESNLYYVAVTRARRSLFLVAGKGGS